jgi:hypothetical protein
MQSFRKTVSGVGLLLVGAFLAAMAQPEPAIGAGSAPVTVVNTPLPVTLSGSVSGTVQAEQSGPWSVTVGNAAGSPVLVRDVDRESPEPFQMNIHLTINAGDLFDGEAFSVPAGKRLVIECVTARTDVFPGQETEVFVTTTVGGQPVSHVVPGAIQKLDFAPGQYDETVSAQLVRFYADAGSTVGVGMRRNLSTNDAGGNVTISGYLLPAP